MVLICCVLSAIMFIRIVMTYNLNEYSETSPCEIGNVVQNECIICVCSHKKHYICSNLECDENGPHKKNDVKNSSSLVLCNANMTYVLNTTTCICNKDGKWPHERCADIFESLPPTNTTKDQCDEDGYIIIGCNVCRCNDKGEVIKSQCTKNICEDNIETRRSKTDVYGECEANNWYSLAPCQFCYCVNTNKLICNTGNSNTKKLQLGAYSLTVCDKDLVKEAMELIPEKSAMLRQNYNKEITESKSLTSKHTTNGNYFMTPENNAVEIDVSRERDINKQKGKVTYNKKTESDSESDEKGVIDDWKNEKIEKGGEGTQLYHEEEESLSTETNYDKKLEYDEDTEEPVKTQKRNKQKTRENSSKLKIDSKATFNFSNTSKKDTMKKIGNSIRMQLPKVLDKVFSMALRKSGTVTIEKNETCEVGSEFNVNCNKCFCLKGSKLLCTNNPCNKNKNH